MTPSGKSMMVKPAESGVVADVYAGDTSAQCRSERAATLFSFVIEVEPEPDALARVVMILNLANTAPRSLHFQRGAEGNATITIAIPLVSDVQADVIRRKVEQLTCTVSVALTETK